MSDQWFYAVNGKQAGPVSFEQLRQLAGSGALSAGDLVWQEGTADWQPAGQVPGLFAAATGGYAPPPPAPTAVAAAAPYPGQFPSQPTIPAYAQPYGQPTYGVGQSYESDARTAMILAIIGIFCAGIILAPIALVLGYKAKQNMRMSGNMQGAGMATAAIVIGWIIVGLAAVGLLLVIVAGVLGS